jgi:hypothetical protein
MTKGLRPELLAQLCDLLPAEEAERIRAMDPDAYQTHVQAYLTARRLRVPLPTRLRVGMVRSFFDVHDRLVAETSDPT